MAQEHLDNEGKLVVGGVETGASVENTPQLTTLNTPPRWALSGQYILDNEEELGFAIDPNHRAVLIQAADVGDDAELAKLKDDNDPSNDFITIETLKFTGTLAGATGSPTGGKCICTVTTGSIYIGDTKTLIATVDPSDATKNKVVWKVSGPAKKTGDNVTFTGGGTVTITATVKNGYSDDEETFTDFETKLTVTVLGYTLAQWTEWDGYSVGDEDENGDTYTTIEEWLDAGAPELAAPPPP
jgi:hypothetical protein